MLAERVKQWTQEWRQAGIVEGIEQGIEKGIEQGRQTEAAKLFMLLMESKFGKLGITTQEKINSATAEQIEAWTQQIFKAKTPEDLLNS